MTYKNVKIPFSNVVVDIDAFLFDHDGTLVDTIPGLVAGHNVVAQHFGRPPLTREDVVQRLASGGGLKIMSDLYGPDSAEAALRLFREVVGEERKKNLTPMPGMERMVRKISGLGVALGIVSNANKAMLDMELDYLDLRKYFPVVVGADEAPRNKPAADPIFLALDRLGLTKEAAASTILVGDSEADLAAAAAAGSYAIFIHESGRAPDGYSPLAVFRSCGECADFLDKAFPSAAPKIKPAPTK